MTDETQPAQLLRVSEAASRLGVSERQVYKLAEAGLLTVTRLPGTGKRPIVRISEEELERYIISGGEVG